MSKAEDVSTTPIRATEDAWSKPVITMGRARRVSHENRAKIRNALLAGAAATTVGAAALEGGPIIVDALSGPDTVACDVPMQAGDSLDSVSRRIGVNIDSITSATTPDGQNINPAMDVLHIPSGTELHVQLTAAECKQVGQIAIKHPGK